MRSVLIITSNLKIGGAQRFVVNFANDLSGIGYDVKLLTINSYGKPNFRGELKSCIKYECLEKRALFSVFGIKKQIKKFEPDIIFTTQNYINNVVIVGKLLSFTNSKLIIREASIISSFQDPVYWVSKILYGFTDKIVAQTSNIKESIIKHFRVKPDVIQVIPNYVDHDLLEKKAEVGSVNIVSEKRFVFLFCGRLHKVKNVDYLMNTLSEVYRSKPEFEFWIIGDGNERVDLEEMKRSQKLNFIKFLGFQENPYSYMKKADCILLASDREGFPNVVVEAMSLNCIAVINNFSGGAAYDILENDLKNYVYDSQSQFNDLVIRILSLSRSELTDLKTKFCLQSKMFSKENLLNKYIS